MLRPGGYFVVGLYNRYGRLMTDLRRGLFRLTGGRAQWLDPYLRRFPKSEQKRRAWFQDQYRHPHESKHTQGEVLDWFRRCGLDFVRGVPTLTPLEGDAAGGLFDLSPPGSATDHFLSQLRQVGTGNREGGFFVMIGRKGGAEA